MQIQIQGSQFFAREAVAFAIENADNERSRETLVYMSPADFLRIALPGQDSAKQERADALFEQGIPYNSLLLLRADETGRAIGHEGRHRARSLLKARVQVVPVRFVSTHIRWGQPNQTFPRYLTGENGLDKIPFPDSIIFPRKEKKQNPAPPSTLHIERINIEEMDEETEEAVALIEKMAKQAPLGISRWHDPWLIARINNKVVGGGWYGIHPGNPATVAFDVVVHPKAQGQGVGEALVKMLIQQYQRDSSDGDLTLRVQVVNPVMEKILDKTGYLRVEDLGRVFYLDPEP